MNVLYATDGGDPARDALALLSRVAAAAKARVTAVTVVRQRGIADEEARPEADLLDSAVTTLQAAGFAAEGRSLQGHPGPAILKEIDGGNYDLALVGAGNRSRLGRLLMGSVSTKLLHASPVSVMIVRRAGEAAAEARVLFGADGSNDADRVLDQIIGLLDPSACRVHILSVAEHLMPQLSLPIPRAGYATSAPTPELEREWTEAARSAAAAAATKLERAGFKTETQATLGAPAARLLAESERVGADLVVVGSRGLDAVERASLGSVSDQVVREAPATLVGRGR
jgi:nucleotide-binding universal stress UspA family protein